MPLRVWLSTTPWVNNTLSATPCDKEKTVNGPKGARIHVQTFYCTDFIRISRYVVIQRISRERPEALCLCQVAVFGGN